MKAISIQTSNSIAMPFVIVGGYAELLGFVREAKKERKTLYVNDIFNKSHKKQWSN